MCAETEKKPSSPPEEEEDATPASKVLGNDDLVGEILDHVDSPTTLVRATLASKRWLWRASDRAFLRRFRARHPPRLLGFFVSGDCMYGPDFVPMNTELISDPAGAMAELPPLPPTLGECCGHAVLLPDTEDGDATTCYHVDVHHVGRNISATVVVLRSGASSLLCSAKSDLTAPPERIPMNTLLAAGKVYMVPVARYIICVDLVAATLFAIHLPDGVAYQFYRNLVLSWGDDAVLYLVHLSGDHLRVWLRRMDDEDQVAADKWVLRDTISLKETCGHLLELSSQPVSLVGVGDNVEFVFLEMADGDNDFVVYLHLGSRKAEKVYQRDPDNDEIIEAYPFYMVRA